MAQDGLDVRRCRRLEVGCIVAGKLAAAGVEVPTVEVEYDGVTMEANALVGDAGIPTLANTARGLLRVRRTQRRVSSEPMRW